MKHKNCLILCGGASSPRGARGQRLELDLWGRNANVFLKIRNITDALTKRPPPVLLDLLDVAAYLYAGDQCFSRGGTGSFDYGDKWTRHLRYVIPVRKPRLWDRPEVKEALMDTLGWMTDDEFEFSFPKQENPPKLPEYLDFDEDTANPSGIEEVCLFSGGLDSLGGAVKESIVDGRKVALVCHSPAPQLNSRQNTLFHALAEKCPEDKRPFFVHVWANKASRFSKDNSQRIRSFLYASLAATIANILELDHIRFYENGPVSLNLPICEALVGAMTTRTTHPKTVHGMSKLLSLLLETDFVVENPFLWKTRTDIVSDIKAADAADLIRYTVSCSHTQGMTVAQPNCGRCSQCIDRRFAVLAASCEEYDPKDSYEVDVLADGRDKTEDRTMLERYLGMATKVGQLADSASFFTKFPEAYRVINGLGGDRQKAAEAVFELCKRQATQINSVMDQALTTAAKTGALRRGDLPGTCAIRLVTSEHHLGSVENDNVGRKSSGDEELPAHYIPCVDISGIIRKRSDAIARSLRAAKYPVIKKSNKTYCDPEHAAVLWPKWKEYWRKQQESP